MRLCAALLLLCSLASPVRAVMISEVTPEGFHVIHDTNTSLTWLSFAHTFVSTTANVDYILQPGMPLSTYRYATVWEVLSLLFDEYGMNQNWYESDIPGMRRFFADFFYPQPEPQRVSGFFDPGYMPGFIWAMTATVYSSDSSYFDYQLVTYPITYLSGASVAGTFLVTETVPEPSTLFLFVTGLLLLLWQHRVKFFHRFFQS